MITTILRYIGFAIIGMMLSGCLINAGLVPHALKGTFAFVLVFCFPALANAVVTGKVKLPIAAITLLAIFVSLAIFDSVLLFIISTVVLTSAGGYAYGFYTKQNTAK